MHDHFVFVSHNAQSLLASQLPRQIQKAAENLAALHPDDHIAIVRGSLAHIRELAESLRGKTWQARQKMAPHVQAVHKSTSEQGIHICLFEALLAESGFPDREAIVEDMIKGFPVTGVIPVSHVASPEMVREQTVSEEQLQQLAPELFERALEAVRRKSPTQGDDAEVWKQTMDDISLGRMAPLRPASLGTIAPTRRFPLKQLSSKGKQKIRIIDDAAESRINDASEISFKIRMGKVSDFVRVSRLLTESQPTQNIMIMKANYKSAYKNCPVLTQHLIYADMILKDPVSGRLVMSTYYSMPFGMVSAVYAWDRLAESLIWIFGYFLNLPLTRYVDDMFMPVYGKHAMEVRNALLEISSLLGVMLDEAKTPAQARCESLLGVSISIDKEVRHGSLRRSISIRLDPVKAEFWEDMIREALRTGSLSSQAAKKLAGRLNFAVLAAVGGTGGTRLKEIYRHSFGFTAYTESLHDELTWWLQRLQSTRPSLCPVGPNSERTCIVYSDAEGNGGQSTDYLVAANLRGPAIGRLAVACLDRAVLLLEIQDSVLASAFGMDSSETCSVRNLRQRIAVDCVSESAVIGRHVDITSQSQADLGTFFRLRQPSEICETWMDIHAILCGSPSSDRLPSCRGFKRFP